MHLATLCFFGCCSLSPRMAAAATSNGASQVLPSQLYGVGLGLKRLSDGALMVNK